MSKNSIKPEPSKSGLFVSFDSPKFTARTSATTIVEQPGSFFSRSSSQRYSTLNVSLPQAGSQQEDANANGEGLGGDDWHAVLDEVLDSKHSPIDKTLQSEQALALYNFMIGKGILARLCEQHQNQLAIVILSQMIHNLSVAERTNFTRSRKENGTYANRFNLAANSINSYLDSEAGSHLPGAQALELNQESQITIAHNDMPPINSRPRGLPPQAHGLSVPNTPRNAARPFATIFFTALNTEQETPEIPNGKTKETIKEHMHSWMLKGFDLIPVGKDDDGQYWPGFGPGVPQATDWRKAKLQGQTPSMDDVKAFWRETTLS
ncbi:MAG: hypothetical protein EZS28_020232 [Streblomastix strix]|uniref:Uncharacterized protein n=1 Tax=Streblomastix strix TaxID=222440 RepID=A0A5J4VP26_9EUKA|nr:MAG: hypothetical protein EZS28_020232 [Streblomastix strix]